MSNHKWASEKAMEYGTKPHVCKRCGVRKYWRGGDYQAWEYIWNTVATAMNGEPHYTTHETFKRPECIPSPPLNNKEI